MFEQNTYKNLEKFIYYQRATSFKMPLSCRFYKHKFPECDEVVMVNVRQIAEMGSYVNLLEYNKIEGLQHIYQ